MATATATSTAAEAELKTYWCHECDMSVSLTWSSSPLVCPHCHTHFLELMDSPFSQNDAEPPLFDVVFQDALALLSPPPPPPPHKTRAAIPAMPVTHALLSRLDPNGVVFCAVCKDPIAVDAEAKLLPCDHLYHSDCITPWLLLRNSCPLCRFRISEVEEEEEEIDDDVVDERNASAIRRQLMVRLSELTEDDFYGLRITLNHIASRHALLHSGAASAPGQDNGNPAPAGEPGGAGC